MDFKRLVILSSVLIFCGACHASPHAFKSASEKTLFSNFTLSICLGMAYEGKDAYFSQQFSTAASAYREYSHISLDAYDEARDLIRAWMSKEYKSKDGKENHLVRCLDAIKSPEFEQIYKKYDPCKTPDAWLDTGEYKNQCK